MARIRHEARLSVSRATGMPLRDVRGMSGTIVYRGTNTPVTLEQYSAPGTVSGIPMANPITITDDGFIPGFDAVGDLPAILYLDWVSGPWVIPVDSIQGLKLLAEEMATLARTAVDLADVQELFAGTGISIEQVEGGVQISATGGGTGGGGSGITGAPSVWPQTFPSSPHSHTVNEVGATSVGRAVMSASDAAAARAAIGAGTGNGTSSLTLGTAGTQAAPGNHTHTANTVTFTPTGSLTATTVQGAIVQAAATGGGGGGDAVKSDLVGYRVRTNGGTGPWEPRPTGYKFVVAYGIDPSPTDQQPNDQRERPVDA